MKGTDIETLKQMTVGDIKQLTESWNRIGDVIDQKKEFVIHLDNLNKNGGTNNGRK